MARLKRRHFLASLPALASITAAAEPRIDRWSVVSRHNPVLHIIDPRAPLSAGNGEFAFTVDVTGPAVRSPKMTGAFGRKVFR